MENSTADMVEYCFDDSQEDVIDRIVYVCSLCLRQYELLEDLRGHMIEYHGCKPIQMKPEENMAQSPRVQQQQDMSSMPSECPSSEAREDIKPVPFKDFRLLLRSKMKMRCELSSFCSYKFEDTKKHAAHVRCHTQGGADFPQEFRCFECGQAAQNWRRCSAHLWKVHQVDVDLLHCPMCNFKSYASVNVWRHMLTHKKWRPLVLRSEKALKLHRQRAFSKESNATTVHPQKKNKYYAEKICEICNRKFVNGKTLSKHVKTVHNKIKPFICNVCGKKTARKASLIIHMRQHTGEKPLQCKTCKFNTRDPSVLKKHEQRHDQKARLQCHHCDYSCIQSIAYKRHTEMKHPEEYEKISCRLCPYVSISGARLLAHMEDHAKGLVINAEESMDDKHTRKSHEGKDNEFEANCFLPVEESVDSPPHEPAVDTGGVTIPAAQTDDTQFATFLNL